MKRREFSAKTKLQAWDRAEGKCESCGKKLYPGDRYEFHHIIPCAMDGESTLHNCSLQCRPCHGCQTRERDQPAIAKSRRVRRKHIGIRKRTSFRGWRKMNGTVVYANRDKP